MTSWKKDLEIDMEKEKKVKVGLIIAVSVIGLITLFVVGRKVKTLFEAWKNRQDNKSEQTILELQGYTLSYPKQWYEATARKIYNGAKWTWYDWNCDEEATLSALTSIKNDLDYLELVSQFGVRDEYDLVGWVRECLNEEEIERVNNVYSGKGITKRI